MQMTHFGVNESSPRKFFQKYINSARDEREVGGEVGKPQKHTVKILLTK